MTYFNLSKCKPFNELATAPFHSIERKRYFQGESTDNTLIEVRRREVEHFLVIYPPAVTEARNQRFGHIATLDYYKCSV